MELKVKRPWSVWIAQIFFAYCVAMVVLGFSLAMGTTERSDRSFDSVLLTLITDVVLIGLFVTAFWGMAVRRTYGRWLGVGMLSFMIIFANLSKVLLPENSAEHTGGIILRILLSILLFVVVAHIAFSERSEAFFIRKIASPAIDHPPPPPTFDD